MLKSKRQVGGAYNTPLKKFKGHFDDYDVQPRKGQFAKEGQQDVLVNFSKITVLETDSPYPYESAQLIFKFSDSINSGWCVLEDSIASVLGINVDDVNIDLLLGKNVLMEREDGHLFFTDKAGTESKGTVWRVVEVEGKVASHVDPWTKALELLEGKTRGEFMGEALTDPAIQGDKALQNMILTGTFFTDAKVISAFDVESDTYVKKA